MALESFNQGTTDSRLGSIFNPEQIILNPLSNVFEFIPEIPGDLGCLEATPNDQYIRYRVQVEGTSENVGFFEQNRYRGVRESFKFNLLVQQLIFLWGLVEAKFSPLENLMETKEDALYPTDDQVAALYRCRTQVEYAEYRILKSAKNLWWD